MATYYVKKTNLNYVEFSCAIKRISAAKSITGINYVDIQVVGNIITGVRESTGETFRVSLKRLYDAYCEMELFSVGLLKPYVDRVQSPSLAILIAIGAVAKSGAPSGGSIS